MTMGADVGDPTHTVDVKHDEVGPAGGGHGGRGVDFELGSGSGEGLPDESPHLALDQIDHDTAQALVGVVNVLGDLDPAVLADGQDTVVIQQGLAAGLLVGFDDILEEDPLLDLRRDWSRTAGMGDVHLPFHGRKDADVDLIRWRRIVGPCRYCHQQHEATSGPETTNQSTRVMTLGLHKFPQWKEFCHPAHDLCPAWFRADLG
jgi:hypothetical protein